MKTVIQSINEKLNEGFTIRGVIIENGDYRIEMSKRGIESVSIESYLENNYAFIGKLTSREFADITSLLFGYNLSISVSEQINENQP